MLSVDELVENYPILDQMLEPADMEKIAPHLGNIEKWSLVFERFAAKGKEADSIQSQEAPGSFVEEPQIFLEVLGLVITDDILSAKASLEHLDTDLQEKILVVSAVIAGFVMGVAKAKNIQEPK